MASLYENLKPFKVDRNGTQYFASNVCRKCGGKGFIYGYEHIDKARCWQCGATGRENKPYTWKKYTPEYSEKLAEKRRQKQMTKAPETNRKFLEKHGFDENGKTYIVAGDTFSIKDTLKASGAKFDSLFGWHFNCSDNGFNCFELSVDEIAFKNYVGEYYFVGTEEILKCVDEHRIASKPKSNSEYIGKIGERIVTEVILKSIHTYRTHFTYYGETNYIYCFEDENGNMITWKTSNYQNVCEDERYTIRGTIKEHSEYKGDKQTMLQRVKFV